MVHRGSRGIALLFFDHSTRGGWGISVKPLLLFTPPGMTRYTLYRRLSGPQGRSGQVKKILPPPGFDPPNPECPARSQSLYRLRYMAHHTKHTLNLLVPELFFKILAHPVYKMWIIQEPNILELWNKLHFEEKKRTVYTMFKIFSTYICWINI